MPENQNIEYKQSWHNDYLKWVCGFANATGGKLFIGIDDTGKITGLSDYKRLMEEIPNKVRDLLGILVATNLHEDKGLYYLEITTPPYNVPISLRGRYYFRSGSTNQELTGAPLNDFLLQKSGRTWDDIAEPHSIFNDIDETSIQAFINAAEQAGRLTDIRNLPLRDLLDKLRLTDVHGNLKRAAIILFAKDPSRFYNNISVKIGRFGDSDSDLKFQEVIEGNLIYLLKEAQDILNKKFLTKKIDFEGLQRIEKGEYPVAALREMLLNALVHRNYIGSTIQIRVYDDKLSIWNEGFLPTGLSLESLKRLHPSRPRNPVIADVCFKGGYIDAWGRGTLKIIEACKQAQLPEPEMIEQDGGFLITLFKNILSERQPKKHGFNDRQSKAVQYVKEHGRITNREYQELNNISSRTASRDLELLIEKEIFKSSGNKGAGSYYELK